MIRIIQKIQYQSDITFVKGFDSSELLPKPLRYFPVVDSNVMWFYERYLRNHTESPFVWGDVCEATKSRETEQQIEDYLFAARADRASVLLAIGGGVVTDVVGCVAGRFKRGITWIAVPTTPLAMVDASVGGKTAINTKQGKNMLGQFYPAGRVIISQVPSETWTDSLRLEGTAEAYKIFRLFDHHSAERLVRDRQIEACIERSVELKAEVCRLDPWESHFRAILNYGHTPAHAIEHSTGMRHGPAVVLGIRIMNQLATDLGSMSDLVRQKVNRDLDQLGFVIPDKLPSFQMLEPLIMQDKKNLHGELRVILLGDQQVAMCECQPTTTILMSDLAKAYRSFCEDSEIVLT